jgi:hypothetical protein
MTTSVQEVREQLFHVLTMRDNAMALSPNLLDDYASIGSFLTDVAACRVYLARLSDALVPPLREAGLVVEREEAQPGQSQFVLKTTAQVRKKSVFKSRVQYFEDQVVKHHKVLTSFFSKWERDAGFNVGTGQRDGDRLPPGPATLTGFVHGDDFRNHLLKHGYHWKDAGVGTGHGEFTHRIHWYMVVEKHRGSNGQWLNNSPVEAFKALGAAETINQKYPWNATQKRVNIWDQVFDNGETNADLNGGGEPVPCPHYQKPNVFRRPETLHKYIQEQRDSPDLWALGFLIWGRTNKRRNEDAATLRKRYQDYIKKHKRHLVRVGFLTGDNQESLGTIIWKR